MKMLALAASAAFFASASLPAFADGECVTTEKVVGTILQANPGATVSQVVKGVQAKGFIAMESALHDQKLEGDTVIIFRSPVAAGVGYVVIMKDGCFSVRALVPDAEIKHALGQDA